MVLREKKVEDDLRWRCLAKKCLKKKISIRKDSIFFGLRLCLKTIMMIIYLWSRDTPIKDIVYKFEIGSDSVKSVLDIIRSKLQGQENLKTDCLGCIAEVDETKLTKKKNNVARVPETIWCVWGVCRVHKNFFYQLEKNRRTIILTEKLKRNVKTNST
ncbi:hypothetical protein CDIK_4123 [Cucumispora dikerogammari]|nr:hypothetical protein CDIK_4123 [Cucumispora dikerogammari]